MPAESRQCGTTPHPATGGAPLDALLLQLDTELPAAPLCPSRGPVLTGLGYGAASPGEGGGWTQGYEPQGVWVWWGRRLLLLHQPVGVVDLGRAARGCEGLDMRVGSGRQEGRHQALRQALRPSTARQVPGLIPATTANLLPRPYRLPPPPPAATASQRWGWQTACTCGRIKALTRGCSGVCCVCGSVLAVAWWRLLK